MEEFDVRPDYPVVKSLDFRQFLSYMLPVMIGHLDVSAPHDNIHATSWLLGRRERCRLAAFPFRLARQSLLAAYFGRSCKR
ncbi:MAG TPA: hypothetical protein VF557_11265 [Jatrophihabitans sp.]|uniref:hypothetical protein n=1 Tax=Jatrophihabitans sp. TaxID=1932789 RepID=UPI002EF15BC9